MLPTFLYSQLDYRDPITGYYDCTRHDTAYFSWGGTYTTTAMVTKLPQDSMVHFYENSSHQWDCRLTTNNTFYTLGSTEFNGLYHLDTISAYYYYTYGPANQPVGVLYFCHKTAPLQVGELVNKSLSIVFNDGMLYLNQQNTLVADKLVIYSIDGKELISENLYSATQSVSTNGLSNGVYLVVLFNKGHFVDSKRIVVYE